MQPKTTRPTAEVTILPLRARAADRGGDRQSAVPIEQPVAPVTQGADGETYQADRALHAMLARLSGGISPVALLLAYTDWLSHLASSPQRQIEISHEAVVDVKRFFEAAQNCFSPGQGPWSLIKPQAQDRRFDRHEWEHPPFNLMAQAFLLGQQWWHNATTGVRGVAKQNEAIVEFSVRQMLDVLSPSNFAATNPEVLRKSFESGGDSFVRGWRNFSSDWVHLASAGLASVKTGDFVVGESIATSRGKVVFRNDLIELIQYYPTTGKVHPEPILIVPAWIMKYYILDLSPQNSLVKYLTGHGFTVFMISWRNPEAADREVAFDDYRKLGVVAALDTIGSIVPGRQVHALGYCLGGTLLSISAATMAGAFQLLRSNDLIWSRLTRDYLMGERAAPSDLMAWNADATRLPYRMHSEYLRKLFLNNDLAGGRYFVEGKPISLPDIHTPMFVVGTLRDHVAPWKSVYKIHFQVDANVTFLLTSGGHNAGIVAPPGEQGHSYRVKT